MKPTFLLYSLLSLILLTGSGGISPGRCGSVSAENGYPTENLLVCTIYLYNGDNIGANIHTTGPQSSSNGGRTWNKMAWDTLITSAIDVDPSGKYVYCACGNGVMSSTDGGRNWRINGGWQMTEIQDIKIDPRSPEVVWAAGAYGLYLSDDGAKSWSRPGDPQPFRYTGTVQPDRDDPNSVFVGTEDGLFVSRDRGATYRRVGPGAPIRSIFQDVRDPAIFWVGTDGQGLVRSIDGGETWEAIGGPGMVINRIMQHPLHPEWLYCGLSNGVAFSKDNGAKWSIVTSNGTTDFAPVYSLLVDDNNPDKIYAGAYDGLYISDDSGSTWHTYSNEDDTPVLDKAVIHDLWQGDLYRGPEEPASNEPGTLAINTEKPSGDEFRDIIAPGFSDSRYALEDYFASATQESLDKLKEGQHVDTFGAVALINQGLATDALWDDIRARYSQFGHSMFDSFPAISFYLNTKNYLPQDIKDLLRKDLTQTYIYRGDTENHWLMYYTSLLLAAQEWPETSAREWYTGRTSQENYDEALGWLNEWARITTTIGQGEFDSPSYYNMYVSPCLLLYTHAKDPALKRQTGMILDLLLADMSTESLYGRYCGGHSRIYDNVVVMGDTDPASVYYYLYFGGIEMPANPHSWVINALFSDYRCPLVIADTVLLRGNSYVQTEVKRVRNQMRYSEVLNPPVYKYDYMTPDYCLGSLQGGILQPIQQHTWDVTWIGSASNTTLFSLHPYYDSRELAMFFPEDPHSLTASVSAQKSSYTNPDKLASSSPYERVFQYRDTLMAVYNIPEGVKEQFVTLYVPDCLNMIDADGWLIGRDGDVYVAVYPISENGSEWITEPNAGFPPARRLKLNAGFAAVIVEIGREADDGSFEDFKSSILEGSGIDSRILYGNGSVIYTNRHGNEMELYGQDTRVLDGQPFDFPEDRLFNGPFINANVGDRIIQITDGITTRTLDFNNLTISQTPPEEE